jgi:hypothetical protein
MNRHYYEINENGSKNIFNSVHTPSKAKIDKSTNLNNNYLAMSDNVCNETVIGRKITTIKNPVETDSNTYNPINGRPIINPYSD